jgi:hypothetical protein
MWTRVLTDGGETARRIQDESMLAHVDAFVMAHAISEDEPVPYSLTDTGAGVPCPPEDPPEGIASLCPGTDSGWVSSGHLRRCPATGG